MFLHFKELIQPVKVGKPDARFGTLLLEQFGGATGELTAALQYWVQSFHVENAGIRDMLQDIAMEEFSHLEMSVSLSPSTPARWIRPTGIVTLTLNGQPEALYCARARITSCAGRTSPDPRHQMFRP